MGRRKIEIQPIGDERNRTITFVKRKAGLFKKAHELAILCQVDIAVIIYNKNNNNFYQFCSCNIDQVLEAYKNTSKIYESKDPSNFGAEFEAGDKHHRYVSNATSISNGESVGEDDSDDDGSHKRNLSDMLGSPYQKQYGHLGHSHKRTKSSNYDGSGGYEYYRGSSLNPNVSGSGGVTGLGVSMPGGSVGSVNSAVSAAASAASAPRNGNSSTATSTNAPNQSNPNTPPTSYYPYYQTPSYSPYNYPKLPFVSSKLNQFEDANGNSYDGKAAAAAAGGGAASGNAAPYLSSNFVFPPPANSNSSSTPKLPSLSQPLPFNGQRLSPVAYQKQPHRHASSNSNIPYSSASSPALTHTPKQGSTSSRPVLRVTIPEEAEPEAKQEASDSKSSPKRKAATPLSSSLPSGLLQFSKEKPQAPHGLSTSNLPPTSGLLSSSVRPLLFNSGTGEQTPVSGFPLASSKYVSEFFPSPSNYYGEWNVGSSAANTPVRNAGVALPLPLNGGLARGSESGLKESAKGSSVEKERSEKKGSEG